MTEFEPTIEVLEERIALSTIIKPFQGGDLTDPGGFAPQGLDDTTPGG